MTFTPGGYAAPRPPRTGRLGRATLSDQPSRRMRDRASLIAASLDHKGRSAHGDAH